MATKRTDNVAPQAAEAARINGLIDTARKASAAGDLATAISSFEELLKVDPANADIKSNLGVLYYNTGQRDRAVNMFVEAHEAMPQNEMIRTNCVKAHVGAANDSIALSNFLQAIRWLRRALSYDPDNSGARVSLCNALEFSGHPAQLSDFIAGATPDQLGQHVMIACMPKSGSTFLKETLCALTGWGEAMLSYAYLQNEQELYLPYLLRQAYENTITQQHFRATGPNLQILQAFGIRPIVLVRNLYDIVLSLSDFYDSGAITNTFFADVWPTLDANGKYDLIIDQVMPWYAGFYASWERVHRLRRLPCLFVTYEDMLSDKPAMITRISEFLGLDKTADDCLAAVQAVDGDATKTRFNKGIAGRGAATLSDDQKTRLRRLVKAYGPVDLARVGLAD